MLVYHIIVPSVLILCLICHKFYLKRLVREQNKWDKLLKYLICIIIIVWMVILISFMVEGFIRQFQDRNRFRLSEGTAGLIIQNFRLFTDILLS